MNSCEVYIPTNYTSKILVDYYYFLEKQEENFQYKMYRKTITEMVEVLEFSTTTEAIENKQFTVFHINLLVNAILFTLMNPNRDITKIVKLRRTASQLIIFLKEEFKKE